MQAAAAGQQQTRINWLYLGTSILYTYTGKLEFVCDVCDCDVTFVTW